MRRILELRRTQQVRQDTEPDVESKALAVSATTTTTRAMLLQLLSPSSSLHNVVPGTFHAVGQNTSI